MAVITEIKDWRDIDLNKIAMLIFNSQDSKLKRLNLSLERIKGIIQEYFMQDDVKYVTAHDKNDLVGFLVIYRTGITSRELNPGRTLGGLPIINQTAEIESIGNKLITETINWAINEGVECIEMKIPWYVHNDQSFYENIISNYNKFGLKPKLRYAEMYCKLGDQYEHNIKIPENLTIKKIVEFKEQDLYKVYYKAFENGDAKFFKYQKEEVKLEYFQDLGFPDNLNKKASIALVHKNELIGFSFVIPDGVNNHISCMCVSPKYQGKGFGKLLLFIIMDILKEQGSESITLGTEVEMKAFNLYHNYGFSITEGFIIMNWQS
jgi:ribosomal protein S18 acetylase RimI-like enzyme